MIPNTFISSTMKLAIALITATIYMSSAHAYTMDFKLGAANLGNSGDATELAAMEAAAGRPVQEAYVGIGAGLFHGSRGTEHDRLEQLDVVRREGLFVLDMHEQFLGGQSQRPAGARSGGERQGAQHFQSGI